MQPHQQVISFAQSDGMPVFDYLLDYSITAKTGDYVYYPDLGNFVCIAKVFKYGTWFMGLPVVLETNNDYYTTIYNKDFNK